MDPFEKPLVRWQSIHELIAPRVDFLLPSRCRWLWMAGDGSRVVSHHGEFEGDSGVVVIGGR